MTGPRTNDRSMIVELDDVCFAYETERVLHDVSLSIGPREFVCAIGPNGGGKTTLLRLVLGRLRPQRGAVRVFGEEPRAVSQRIGYVPQYLRFDPQFPVSVSDVVLMGRIGCRPGGWYDRADRVAVQEALAEVDLAGSMNRSFADLSGGQRQRVLIARALACQPELLLLDEPMVNLDRVTEQKLYALFRQLSQRMTVVLVSHDVGVVANIADRVLCVNRSVAVHPVSELTGDVIQATYGEEVALVDHGHHHGHGH